MWTGPVARIQNSRLTVPHVCPLLADAGIRNCLPACLKNNKRIEPAKQAADCSPGREPGVSVFRFSESRRDDRIQFESSRSSWVAPRFIFFVVCARDSSG